MKPKESRGKAYFIGEYKQMVNGNIIDDVSIESTYDGNKMHIDKRDNNVVSHLTIKNKQLHNLLNGSTSQESLFERLSKDFNNKRMSNKKTQKKGKGKGKGKGNGNGKGKGNGNGKASKHTTKKNIKRNNKRIIIRGK